MPKPMSKGNPFPAADIKEGEAILDLGSGFGVDAILAAFKVGEAGRVFGIDISEKEVYAANVRAYQRNLRNIVFLTMDMEKLDFKSDVIDCVISNGMCAQDLHVYTHTDRQTDRHTYRHTNKHMNARTYASTIIYKDKYPLHLKHTHAHTYTHKLHPTPPPPSTPSSLPPQAGSVWFRTSARPSPRSTEC